MPVNIQKLIFKSDLEKNLLGGGEHLISNEAALEH